MTFTNSPTYIDSVETAVFAEVLNENNVVVVDVLIAGIPGSPGVGIPTGGTTGQFVIKNGPTDYDIAFSTFPNAETIGLISALAIALGG